MIIIFVTIAFVLTIFLGPIGLVIGIAVILYWWHLTSQLAREKKNIIGHMDIYRNIICTEFPGVSLLAPNIDRHEEFGNNPHELVKLVAVGVRKDDIERFEKYLDKDFREIVRTQQLLKLPIEFNGFVYTYN
jgi:hypothetical protein